MTTDPRIATQEVEAFAPKLASLVEEINRVIVGQKSLIERLLIGLLADGHILVEGVPGLAKTTAVKTLAQAVHAQFQRIQFTPDLLPADVVGTQIYSSNPPRTGKARCFGSNLGANPDSPPNPHRDEDQEFIDGRFIVKKGPIFANLILADEINRAPAKVQSALLEAMQERQVTIGQETFPLPTPFLVMATQNPIEQEGTYPLPEAQVDRFLLKVRVDYPSVAEEILIMKRVNTPGETKVRPVLSADEILQGRHIAEKIHVDEKLYGYIADVVFATRTPEKFGLEELKPLIQFGASPRASIYLVRAARAHALLQGRGYVTPQDIKAIGYDVLRHRILLTYEAEARDMNADHLIQKIFDKINVP